MSSAFIYKVQDYGESSKLLFTYTPYGKITLIAKGAKNYKNLNYSLTEYFSLIEVDLKENKTMQTLAKASLLKDYPLYKGLDNIKYLKSYISALNYLITDDLPHERLFKLLVTLLDFKNIRLGLVTFYIKLTYALGYQLTFYKHDYQGFNLTLGKTISTKENLKIDLNKRETDFLKEIYFLTEEVEIEEEILLELEQFIKKYYKYHIDYNIEV